MTVASSYTDKYPCVRWVEDAADADPHRGWADVVCTTGDTAYSLESRVGHIATAVMEARLYHVSARATAIAVTVLDTYAKGTPSLINNLLLVGPRHEFERIMELAEWGQRKQARVTNSTAGGGGKGIKATLLRNAGAGVWHRHLILKTSPAYVGYSMAVNTIGGTRYATPDPPKNILRTEMAGVRWETLADAVIYVGRGLGGFTSTPAGHRMLIGSQSTYYDSALCDHVDDIATINHLRTVCAALSDHARNGDENAARVIIVGDADFADILLLRAISAWAICNPAHVSAWSN